MLVETLLLFSVLSFVAGVRCHGLYKFKQQVAMSYSLQGVGHDGVYSDVEWYDRARKFLLLSTILFGVSAFAVALLF